MFLAQLALSMLVWAATIVVLARRKDGLIARFKPLSRGRRAALSIALLLTSISALALAMLALANGGLTPAGLTAWGWPLITVVGSLFVLLQTAALVPLVLNAVTPERDGSSDRLDRP